MPFSTARQEPLWKTSSRAGRCAVLSLLPILFAAGGGQSAWAEGTRTLTIHHTHTRENITVTFKRNGRYDDAGLAKLNHFLRDWRNDETTRMDPRLFDVVWEVYQEVGGREPIQIISAYRSPQTNAMLRRRSRGVAKFSQHMLGRAMDFNIPGVSLEKIRIAGLRLQRGGVGFYPSSGSPFVHLDVGSVRHWPRLPPDVYAQVMAGARTVQMASADRGETAAAAPSGRSKRSWFARLFSGGTDEEEDESVDTAPPARVNPREAAPPRTQLAAAVPMPRPRPTSLNTMVAVAAASTPAQVVSARGLWSRTDTAAAHEAPPLAHGGERLVWRVGPQPVNAPVNASDDSSVVAKRVPAPRPRPEVALAAAVPDITASLPPWPLGARQDRVPSDLVMAYAASAATEPAAAAPRVQPQPMGSLRPQRPAAASAKPEASPRRAAAPARVPAGRLDDNPWLRALMMAPSVHASVNVTALGMPDYRGLARLMHKPAFMVVNRFAVDQDFGPQPHVFSGPAVTFVPVVAFGALTARLN